MNVSEALYGAADHIEAFGHHKGGALGEGSSYNTSPSCAVGAVTVVALTDLPTRRVALDALDRYVGHCGGIVMWNDAPERTASEVVEALRACAVIEAAKENSDTRQSVSA